MKTAVLAALLLLVSVDARAEDWTVGVASGAFVFGDLAERRTTISNEEQTIRIESSLSAETRPGLTVDIERLLNSRWSLRVDGTFTRAELAVKTNEGDSEEDSVSIRVGELDVTTFSLAGVFRFNSGGALRPYLMVGPAYVLYDVDPDDETGAIPLFEGERGEFAAIGGGGLEWWLGDSFAIRGEFTDTYSKSPLRESDFGSSTAIEIKEPHHFHTTLGGVFRF